MTQTIILPSTATVVNIPKTNACTMSASSSVILWKVAWWLLYSVGSRHHEEKFSSIGCVRHSCEVVQSINPVLALSFLVSDVFSILSRQLFLFSFLCYIFLIIYTTLHREDPAKLQTHRTKPTSCVLLVCKWTSIKRHERSWKYWTMTTRCRE